MTTNFPHPGMKVFIESDAQILEFLDTSNNIQTIKNVNTPVSNYEYEVKENEKKRSIQILNPEFIGLVETDIKNMMKYARSSQFVNSNTKKAYNPRTSR